MNIEKIRKALNDAEKHFIGYGRAAVAKQMEEALAELDKAPKVLTDEEIERVANTQFTHATSYSVYVQRESWKIALRYARDNGYLSPASGLTVDEAMECVHKWIGLPFVQDDLRARLTAAIEAKTNNK